MFNKSNRNDRRKAHGQRYQMLRNQEISKRYDVLKNLEYQFLLSSKF